MMNISAVAAFVRKTLLFSTQSKQSHMLPRPRILFSGLADEFGDGFGILCALHGDGAVADEAGYAGDTHLHERVGFARDRVAVGVACEQVFNDRAVEADLCGDVCEDGFVANVTVVRKEGGKERFFHLHAFALALRPVD